MTRAGDEPRRRWIVGARKKRYRDRDVAHRVMADPAERGYFSIIGADSPDDDEQFPVGSDTAYSAELTDAEAEEFRERTSNARYVEPDTEEHPCAGGVPTATTLAWLRAGYVDLRRWHGRDVPVAILDQGTTQAVRDYMGWTLVARTVIGDDPAPAEIFAGMDHGCLVAPNGVPAGGRLLDALVTLSTGTSSASRATAGMTWAADLGCKIIVYSFSGTSPSTVYEDTFTYLATLGVQVYAAVGNDGLSTLGYPAAYSTTYPGVHSVVAFTEWTDRIAAFSNRSADASGGAPGDDVASLTPEGVPRTWDGTSAAAPHAAQLCARGATGGTYTAAQVAAALDVNTRDTGSPASEQGHGAYDLRKALTALSALPPAVTAASTATVVEALGWAGLVTEYIVPTSATVAVGDLRVVVIVSSDGAKLTVPHGWELLRDQSDGTTSVRVCARVHRAGDPASTRFFFQSNWRSSGTLVTLRAAGGIDPATIVPLVKFVATATMDSLPIDPLRTNDLLVALFAQRHPTAPTGALSTPTGLTSQVFTRPPSGTTGYPTRLATAQLATAARTGTYVATGDAPDTPSGVAVVLTVPTLIPATTPPGVYLTAGGDGLVEVVAATVSGGTPDAGKILRLDGTGRLDTTLLPVGIGADTAQVVAGEALSGGDLVNVYAGAGSFRVRKADASVTDRAADGFVLAAVASGGVAAVYFEGTDTALTGLAPGVRYLSATAAGQTTAAAPTAAGHVMQPVGVATSPTTMNFEAQLPIVLV